MSRCRAPYAAERGQTLVEFALAASIALTLIFASVEFARGLYAYDLVAQGARVGTRYAITHATIPPHDCSNPAVGTAPCDADITAYIDTKMTGVNASQLATPIYTWEAASATCPKTASPGCYVRIELDYTFTFVALPLPKQTIKSISQVIISQ